MEHENSKTFVEQLVQHLGAKIQESVVHEDDGRVRIALTTVGDSDVVGRDGEYITALNHIAKRAGEHQGWAPFSIDINGYYQARTEALETKARMSAERARSYKTDIEMDPMNSYERMVVHSALSTEDDIATESAGAGKDRRVVIKYCGNDDATQE